MQVFFKEATLEDFFFDWRQEAVMPKGQHIFSDAIILTS